MFKKVINVITALTSVVAISVLGCTFENVAVRRSKAEQNSAYAGNSSHNIVVRVDGEVENSGKYTLPAGSSTGYVLYSAGGVTDDADVSKLNFRSEIKKNCTLYVPKYMTDTDHVVVNINTADEDTLELIPGIGKVTAARIAEYRGAGGRFAQPSDIMRIKGIGRKTFDKMKDYIKTED